MTKDFKPQSPSKMSEEEKTQYKNKLFREADELDFRIKKQLFDLDGVRSDIRDTIKDSKSL